MADVYKNLGEIISYEEKPVGDGTVLKLKFKRPNSQTPDKELSYNVQGQWVDKIDLTLLEKVYGVESGNRVCVHVGKDDKGYPLVVDITDAKDATDGKKAYGNSQYKKGGNYTPRDDSGIAVGAAWTNAIEILKMDGGAHADEDTVEIVARIAERVLKIKLAQEARLKASKETGAAAKEEQATKAMSKADEIKAKIAAKKKEAAKPKVEEELVDGDIGDIDFSDADE